MLHLIDGAEDDVVKSYKTIRHELREYGDILSSKTEIVALNKIDALTFEAIKEKQMALSEVARQDVVAISGVSGAGIERALRNVFSSVIEFRAIKGVAERSDKDSEKIDDIAVGVIGADDD